MADVGTWAKLAAYVVCIGLVLEFAHRVYWRINRWAMKLATGPTLRAILSALCATIPLISALLVTWGFCTYVDRRSFESLGLQATFESTAVFVEGIAIAFAVVTLVFMAGYNFGWYKIERSSLSRHQVPSFCGGVCDFSMAAVFEEIAFRGYVFTVLSHTWGVTAAVVGSSLVFSLLHIIKHPKMPLIFTLNAFIFGVVTAQARLMTGALWASIGLHFGWNLAMGPIYGLPCSGRVYDGGLVECQVEGPDWVTGGLYSPDAGIIGTGALTLTSFALAVLLHVC
ncbi:MAG: type II CAAX endopeptidase family protein [Armatimonadota bacterium]